MGRKVVFFMIILFGLAAGLAYGWWVKPASTADNPLSALRQDYKSDYVLMVAEVYNKDGDLKLAMERLSELEKGDPLQTASNALVYARNAGYSINDLEIISTMVQNLQGFAPLSAGTATP
jgi:hypothetical protein